MKHVRKPLSKSLLQEVKAAEAQKAEKEVKAEGEGEEAKAKAEKKRKEGTPLAHAFADGFPGHKYVRSTYSDNWRAWEAAGKVVGVQEQWIAAGRSESGTWGAFRKECKSRK